MVVTCFVKNETECKSDAAKSVCEWDAIKKCTYKCSSVTNNDGNCRSSPECYVSTPNTCANRVFCDEATPNGACKVDTTLGNIIDCDSQKGQEAKCTTVYGCIHAGSAGSETCACDQGSFFTKKDDPTKCTVTCLAADNKVPDARRLTCICKSGYELKDNTCVIASVSNSIVMILSIVIALMVVFVAIGVSILFVNKKKAQKAEAMTLNEAETIIQE